MSRDDHFVPSVINHMILRGEFFTAYTPYQPEASQGTLRTIYEYQTMIAELTGMDVANASIYDGASSLAEAALMAAGITGRPEIVLAAGVNPLYRHVTATYCAGRGVDPAGVFAGLTGGAPRKEPRGRRHGHRRGRSRPHRRS